MRIISQNRSRDDIKITARTSNKPSITILKHYIDLAGSRGEGLGRVSFRRKPLHTNKEDAFLSKARRQINEYLSGQRKKFTIKLFFKGSAFQEKVWRRTQMIPFGRTATYGQIARSLGAPKASRAVGGALGANPLMIIIPCHRVIKNDGSAGGYACGSKLKKTLLAFERLA